MWESFHTCHFKMHVCTFTVFLQSTLSSRPLNGTKVHYPSPLGLQCTYLPSPPLVALTHHQISLINSSITIPVSKPPLSDGRHLVLLHPFRVGCVDWFLMLFTIFLGLQFLCLFFIINDLEKDEISTPLMIWNIYFMDRGAP